MNIVILITSFKKEDVRISFNIKSVRKPINARFTTYNNF